MNADPTEIIKRIIADLDSDKEAKKALTKAIKMRFVEELKSASEKERPFTQAYFAQKLHEEGHYYLALCNKTLDTLCESLFSEEVPAALPELALQPQAAQRLATKSANKKAPHRNTTEKLQNILRWCGSKRGKNE
jgi:hypothetical protein